MSAMSAQMGAGVLRQLEDLESRGGDGTLRFDDGIALSVSNLDKVYFPDDRITKGDVMRYYTRVAPLLLPLIADRPLILKRYPEGIAGFSFYQQKAPNDIPGGVRVETVSSADGPARRLVGGTLPTLLYCVQLGAITVDPWHSRIGDLEHPDYAILDLDPGAGVSMASVVRVAGYIMEVLDDWQVVAAAKLSGSRGIHVFIPLPPRTPSDEALELTREIAEAIASANPKEATTERQLKKRPPGSVYIDFLQNMVGKSVTTALSVRARPGATISTPLEWAELSESLDPTQYTIAMTSAELEQRGRRWTATLKNRNQKGPVFAEA
jgi:bifunctional non-homologous end joining protein LigD